MATNAQILANRANAQHSTGPRTAEGKQNASRNNLRHGLTLGVLAIAPEEQDAFCEFEASFRVEACPEGILEEEAFQQFVDGAWRLRKIERLLANLFREYGQDPFIHSEADAKSSALTRYRAAAEMIAFRALKTLRELQTTRLAREFHLTPAEREVIPPLVRPAVKMMLDKRMLAHNDREIFYHIYKAQPFNGRLQKAPPFCLYEPKKKEPSSGPACSGSVAA